MEAKIIKDEHKDMLKEFINRSYMPNHMNNSFKNIFYKSLESLNKTLERKPILIRLARQGHCLNNVNLYEILHNTLND